MRVHEVYVDFVQEFRWNVEELLVMVDECPDDVYHIQTIFWSITGSIPGAVRFDAVENVWGENGGQIVGIHLVSG